MEPPAGGAPAGRVPAEAAVRGGAAAEAAERRARGAERALGGARPEWARRAGAQRAEVAAIRAALGPVLESAAARAGELEDARRRGVELERECAALRAENAALSGRCEAAEARHAALQRDFQAVMLESVRLAQLATCGEDPAPAPALAPDPASTPAATLADQHPEGHPATEAPPACREAAPVESAGYSEKLFQRTLREFQAASSESSWEAASSEAASEQASACSAAVPASSAAGQGSSFFGIPWGDVRRQLAVLRTGASLVGPHLSEDEDQTESESQSEEEAKTGAGGRGGRAGALAERAAASQASWPGGGPPSSARSNSWGSGAPAEGPRGRELLMRYRHALAEVQRTSGPGTLAALERGRLAAPGQSGGAQKENFDSTPPKGESSDAGRPWKPPGRAALRTALPGNARIQGGR